jgi:hypothetical protein
MIYILQIGFVKIAPGKAQVINGIQKVCFSYAVISIDANDLLIKRKGLL